MISVLDDATALVGIDRITGLPPRRDTEMFISKSLVLSAPWITSGSTCNSKTASEERLGTRRTTLPNVRLREGRGRWRSKGRGGVCVRVRERERGGGERGRKKEVVPEGQLVSEEGKSRTYKCTKKRVHGERHQCSYTRRGTRGTGTGRDATDAFHGCMPCTRLRSARPSSTRIRRIPPDV
ncbi:hypothetical protein ALC57_02172 [Trachymyrmex cornetzi]|uniref:Uncharacterized protein n=1 Tax=Trachymyrmex cornetzi TaxID=471704 RepID=A0A195EJL5_9HYME|nr:hypothetical protein ALC57_02172 [Trachymyrmex cornetzi]